MDNGSLMVSSQGKEKNTMAKFEKGQSVLLKAKDGGDRRTPVKFIKDNRNGTFTVERESDDKRLTVSEDRVVGKRGRPAGSTAKKEKPAKVKAKAEKPAKKSKKVSNDEKIDFSEINETLKDLCTQLSDIAEAIQEVQKKIEDFDENFELADSDDEDEDEDDGEEEKKPKKKKTKKPMSDDDEEDED